MGFARPCLDCGTLTRTGSRCERHQAIVNANIDARKAQRTHYSGSYRSKAKQVRDNAVVCWLCGDGARVNDPWTADHYIPRDPTSPLLPAHRSCNSSRQNTPANGTRGG
jgi:hypothetical protein